MEKHRTRRGLFYGGILLFCGCALYRPQLLAALLAAVRDIALPPLLGGLLVLSAMVLVYVFGRREKEAAARKAEAAQQAVQGD